MWNHAQSSSYTLNSFITLANDKEPKKKKTTTTRVNSDQNWLSCDCIMTPVRFHGTANYCNQTIRMATHVLVDVRSGSVRWSAHLRARQISAYIVLLLCEDLALKQSEWLNGLCVTTLVLANAQAHKHTHIHTHSDALRFATFSHYLPLFLENRFLQVVCLFLIGLRLCACALALTSRRAPSANANQIAFCLQPPMVLSSFQSKADIYNSSLISLIPPDLPLCADG